MFEPHIGPQTTTPEIMAQVVDALNRQETVRLGRWVAWKAEYYFNVWKGAERHRSGELPTNIDEQPPVAQSQDATAIAGWLIVSWNQDW